MAGVFWTLALLQILLGIFSVREGLGWRRFAVRSLRARGDGWRPCAVVICPCKGADEGLAENLQALTVFSYPAYEILFVTARPDDPSHSAIEEAIAHSPRPARHIAAGSPSGCSEKVNNLQAAVEAAGDRFEVLVFADSDGRPGPDWLERLVAPLAEDGVGGSTTFRWIFPAPRAHGSRLAALLASAWNAAILTMLGERNKHFCWGGGTAITRANFEKARVTEYWRGAVSDDWALTRSLHAAGLRIAFVPECLTPSPQSFTAKSLLEFTNRQLIMTRVYSPGLWAAGALAHGSYVAALLAGTLAGFERWSHGQPNGWIVLAIIAFLGLALLKAWFRLDAVKRLLPDYPADSEEVNAMGIALSLLAPFLYVVNFCVSAFQREICWRGIRYRIESTDRTAILQEKPSNP